MSEEKTVGLSSLAPARGSRHRRKRVGFGESSGLGKTCGKGNKGARARAGFKSKPGFEGGQMPLHRRLPKVGFTSRKKVSGENVYTVISLDRLSSLSGDSFSLADLRTNGVLRQESSKVKILGGGAVTRKITVEAHAVSASARSAIEAAGGEVRLITVQQSS